MKLNPKHWAPISFFLIQCVLFSFQLYLWIFSQSWIGIVTVPLAFLFVCFSLWIWQASEH